MPSCLRFAPALALLMLAAFPVRAQPGPLQLAPPSPPLADPGPHAVTLRAAGAVGGMVAALYGTFILFYGSEADLPPAATLLLPIAGASGGSYLVGRVTRAPGSFSGAVVGTTIGMVPGIVVLAAAGSSTDAETAGALVLVGGAAIGAAVGYGSERLSLGLSRLPGGIAPTLHARF